MKNLFVGNMSFQTTADDLRALFEPFGQLARVHVATDRETGRARGFGFVEMPNDAEAAKAIAALDGKDVGGRKKPAAAVRAAHVVAPVVAVKMIIAATPEARAAIPVAAAAKKDSQTKIIAKSRASRASLAGNNRIRAFRRTRIRP
jgi:hypothetical protein